MKQKVSDKWQFVPEKECYYCYRDLTEELKNYKGVITGCPFCHRSFCD